MPLPILLAASPPACRLRRQNFISRALTTPPATQATSNPFQPGPIYFKTPRKCGLFGVICEGLPRQVNFIIDEASSTGKGANTTISYVHYYFKKHGLGETDVHLNVDNCAGQNKNNYFLWHLAWRTMMNLHHSITYSFLVAGHTKFAPDRCFGLIKKAYKVNYVSSLYEFARLVETSSSTGINKAQLVGTHDGRVIVPLYDWISFLQEVSKHYQVSSFPLFTRNPWSGILQRICVKPRTIVYVVKEICHSSIFLDPA